MSLPEGAVPLVPRRWDLGSLVEEVANARYANVGAAPERIRVDTLAIDSRAVRPGALFFALRGTRTDGHAFVAAAHAAGAAASVVDPAGLIELAEAGAEFGPVVVVPVVRLALSRLAARFYGEPSHALDVIGVTGTNGKTTTTFLIEAVLEAGGIATGRIGTLGAAFRGATAPLANTTPLALEMHATLAVMRAAGARSVAVETSSHALALDRVADVRFAAAVLTNVTRDHLDFHPSFEEYAAAKRRLFARETPAILNLDDPIGAAWAHAFAAERGTDGAPVVTYAQGRPDADVAASQVDAGPHGTTFAVDGQRFELALPGRFNVSNALAAIAVARRFGIADVASARALAAFERVPGRMERYEARGVTAIVDYAHTPDALEIVLSTARDFTHGSLHVVFGCGGDRDSGKRPMMGRIAALHADRIVVTSDNPRSESPQLIAGEIVGGMPLAVRAARRVAIELDRRAAIRLAIASATPGDVVVVAGKGHETVQIANGRARDFDDAAEVRAAFEAVAR